MVVRTACVSVRALRGEELDGGALFRRLLHRCAAAQRPHTVRQVSIQNHHFQDIPVRTGYSHSAALYSSGGVTHTQELYTLLDPEGLLPPRSFIPVRTGCSHRGALYPSGRVTPPRSFVPVWTGHTECTSGSSVRVQLQFRTPGDFLSSIRTSDPNCPVMFICPVVSDSLCWFAATKPNCESQSNV